MKGDKILDRRAMVPLALLALGYSLLVTPASGAGRTAALALSSWVGLLAMLPFLRRATLRFAPPRLPWPAVPLAHLPVALFFSAGHVVIATALNLILFRLMGLDDAPFGSSPASTFLKALRTDLIFYAVAVPILLAARRRQA